MPRNWGNQPTNAQQPTPIANPVYVCTSSPTDYYVTAVTYGALRIPVTAVPARDVPRLLDLGSSSSDGDALAKELKELKEEVGRLQMKVLDLEMDKSMKSRRQMQGAGSGGRSESVSGESMATTEEGVLTPRSVGAGAVGNGGEVMGMPPGYS
ncbi:hypothetical protein SAICODRAFT_16199 [Saitoella complicata NRRL Y-17804]|nr:uncharacterized protein SAICODRAFT_16199 [Saitoella complicata NRRL Y-17804]ODQ56169.1 hypothetical protein SAICODRAFT_16199 [Saitoella complicata NRRL Y-17804]